MLADPRSGSDGTLYAATKDDEALARRTRCGASLASFEIHAAGSMALVVSGSRVWFCRWRCARGDRWGESHARRRRRTLSDERRSSVFALLRRRSGVLESRGAPPLPGPRCRPTPGRFLDAGSLRSVVRALPLPRWGVGSRPVDVRRVGRAQGCDHQAGRRGDAVDASPTARPRGHARERSGGSRQALGRGPLESCPLPLAAAPPIP